MNRQKIKHLVENRVREDGITETGVKGVQLFRVSNPVRCLPAVYEPSVVAIVNGAKEAILDGQRYIYDSNQYMCCPISLPVE
ncbi:MAG: AraC family transcriptional regulator, partial [Roseibium sp.]